MEQLQLALVGCGGMAGAHVRGLEELAQAGIDDIQVVACCDLVEAQAQQRPTRSPSSKSTSRRYIPTWSGCSHMGRTLTQWTSAPCTRSTTSSPLPAWRSASM